MSTKKGKKKWLIVGLAAVLAALDTAAGSGLLPAAVRPVVEAVAAVAVPVK